MIIKNRERSANDKIIPLINLTFTCLLLLLLSSNLTAQNKFVKATGKIITAPDGTELKLKGINLGNWLVPEGYMFKFKTANSPRLINEVISELIGPDKTEEFWKSYRGNYITRDDIAFIKKAGFNSIRLPFHYKLFDKNSVKETFFTGLDKVISWCGEEGLYVILDMHCAPGGQTGDNIDDSWGYPYLFENTASKARAVAVWKSIAVRYADDPAVLGYDLLNEPIAPYFDIKKLNPKLEPLYKEITAAIRTVDKNHIVFLGGSQWDSNLRLFRKPFDNNLVYTFHKYWSDTTQAVIQEYVNFREKYNVPVWMGESGENTDSWISSFRRLLEKNDIGWCFWPYKKMNATTCIASINRTAEFDSVIAFANAPRTTFKEIRERRPSPQVIEKALGEYLEFCKFKNCKINPGYLEALGLKSGE